VIMKVKSFSDAEFMLAGKSGQMEAIGRVWRFAGPDDPRVLNLFVGSPGALPIPQIGSEYQITPWDEKSKLTQLGLLGYDREGCQWYRILPSPGNE